MRSTLTPEWQQAFLRAPLGGVHMRIDVAFAGPTNVMRVSPGAAMYHPAGRQVMYGHWTEDRGLARSQ